MNAHPSVGVIGVGAMGGGVAASLRRNGFDTHVRDIRPEAMQEGVALGAHAHPTPAALAAQSDILIVLVVDVGQVETVLFGAQGAVAALRPEAIVMLASTLDPDDVATLATKLAAAGAVCVDAPVSGGPKRATEGTMTMMIAGPADALARCEPVLAAIAGKVFRVGTVPGTAAKFKIVNNLLAAVNLAAGAEALALATAAGLDIPTVVDVINASSGASWMFADRMPRALADDYAPRAAAKILAKDVGIAATFAARHRVGAPFAQAARAAFDHAVATGHGEEDDAIVYVCARTKLPSR
ncbi:MAG: NAD(P)-dependent oxidoreductase [Betaproteobacteria bacterium]